MEGASNSMAGIQSALSTAFSDVASNVNTTITTILPIALGIVGAVLVVTVGIKLFKKFTAKA